MQYICSFPLNIASFGDLKLCMGKSVFSGNASAADKKLFPVLNGVKPNLYELRDSICCQ
jgi:hypothetical protein